MPYIITTTTPTYSTSVRGTRQHGAQQTRRAVATLEEARDYVGELFNGPWWTGDVDLGQKCYDAGHALPEQGGMVGPLPEGTLIEVEPVATNWLIGCCDDLGVELGEDATTAEIIAAYNAAQDG